MHTLGREDNSAQSTIIPKWLPHATLPAPNRLLRNCSWLAGHRVPFCADVVQVLPRPSKQSVRHIWSLSSDITLSFCFRAATQGAMWSVQRKNKALSLSQENPWEVSSLIHTTKASTLLFSLFPTPKRHWPASPEFQTFLLYWLPSLCIYAFHKTQDILFKNVKH